MANPLADVWQQFQTFSPGDVSEVRVFFSPGRVNLIGEHTDYNGGYVFPAALEMGTWAFVRPRQDRTYRFASTAYDQVVTVHADSIEFRREDDFANYPKGVVWTLAKQGVSCTGADFLFYGNLPSGAGLSSSASIEVVSAYAINALAKSGLTNSALAVISQKAENDFVGVNCGIMDQFSVAMGERGHAICLNCFNLDFNMVPLDTSVYKIVITNTNKRRGLTDSKYNERRAECEAALDMLRQAEPRLQNLSEISLDEWSDLARYITDPTLMRRAQHVITENHRTQRGVKVLTSGDLPEFGRLMNQSHLSLRDDYEVTGPELDALAQAACHVEGCLGSRMTGAGFGGCTVSLVHREVIDEFKRLVSDEYTRKTGLEPTFYTSGIGDGVKELKLQELVM